METINLRDLLLTDTKEIFFDDQNNFLRRFYRFLLLFFFFFFPIEIMFVTFLFRDFQVASR